MINFQLGSFLFAVKACSSQTSQSLPAQALVFYYQIYVHVTFTKASFLLSRLEISKMRLFYLTKGSWCWTYRQHSKFSSIKFVQNDMAEFNYFLTWKINRFINKVVKVLSRVIYSSIFSILHTTFRQHYKQSKDSKSDTGINKWINQFNHSDNETTT